MTNTELSDLDLPSKQAKATITFTHLKMRTLHRTRIDPIIFVIKFVGPNGIIGGIDTGRTYHAYAAS